MQGRGRGEGGQATAELAMLLPVVIVVLLTVVQLGLLARDRLLVAHAGREAARAAAVDPDPSTARRAAEASADALDPNRLDVVLRAATGSGVAAGDRLQVLVRYRAESDLPVVGALLPDITMASEVTVRVE
ncbi:MAG: TadE/TadG family type IV pilus assembly protein [Actinomycetota bacterium]